MTTQYTASAIQRNKWDLISKAAAGTEKPGDVAVMDDAISIGVYQGLEAGASGERALWKISGQFELLSASATTFAVGADVFWNTSTKLAVTTLASNCVYAGKATKAKVNGETRVLTDINLWLGAGIVPQSTIAALTDNSGGTTADGTIAAVAATAGSCAGGSTPTATQVDTAIATAVATIVSGSNDAVKELATKLNAVLAALKSAGVIASS